MMRSNGHVRRCSMSSVREHAASSRLRSFMRTPPSIGSSQSDGGVGKKLRTMMSSSPEAGVKRDTGRRHADGAEADEEDVSGCISDDPPSAEVAESLIKSGVPVSEGSGVVDSLVGEICERLLGLPTLSEVVVSDNS